jgi:hypothetical protein
VLRKVTVWFAAAAPPQSLKPKSTELWLTAAVPEPPSSAPPSGRETRVGVLLQAKSVMLPNTIDPSTSLRFIAPPIRKTSFMKDPLLKKIIPVSGPVVNGSIVTAEMPSQRSSLPQVLRRESHVTPNGSNSSNRSGPRFDNGA